MTREEAAEYLTVSVRTFNRHAAKHLPVVRIGSSVRYDVDDLDDWIDKQKVQPISDVYRAAQARPRIVHLELSPAAKKIRDRLRASMERQERRLANGGQEPPRDGDRQQACNSVHRLVNKGTLPHANTVLCKDCGHVVGAGDKTLHVYDHPRGYGATHHLDVEAVCVPCHRRRIAVRKRPARG